MSFVGSFLRFQPLTLVPIQSKLIDTSLLQSNEIDWINNYHMLVRDSILPLLPTELSRNWMVANTNKII